MKIAILRMLTPANVIAVTALIVALGGTGYAATTLADKSVTTPKLANSAVTAPKLANGSVQTAKLASVVTPDRSRARSRRPSSRRRSSAASARRRSPWSPARP